MRRGKRGTTGASVDHRYCVLLPTDPSVGLRKEIATSRFDKPEMNSTASRRSRTEFSTE